MNSILLAITALYVGLSPVCTTPEANSNGKFLEPSELRNISFYPETSARKVLGMEEASREYFVREGCIFRHTAAGDTCIKRSEGPVSYGEAVSRNEFGGDRGLFFPECPSTRVAFYRKDESAVRLFHLLDITRCESLPIRYPMNGEPSEKLALGVYDSATDSTVWIDVNDFTSERYLTNVSWAGDTYLYVQVLDREQHNMRLNRYSALDGRFLGTVLSESNEAWVEPREPLRFFSPEETDIFVYETDNRDGFKALYLADISGTVRRIVDVNADIEFKGIQGDCLYYVSAEDSPAGRQLFRVKISRRTSASKARISKPERLTFGDGWHEITFGRDGRYTDFFSSVGNPGVMTLCGPNGKILDTLEVKRDPLEGYARASVEFGTVPSADGQFQNHYRLIRPLGFDSSKKYPLIVYVYGGPHSQLVKDTYLAGLRTWEMVMAQRGYVVYVQDNRGTLSHGTEYEKAINRACGQVESDDQMVGIRALLEQPWIDSSRVGVHGWSYGGFMTLTLATRFPDVFKCAAAGGPVIDWKWYEIMYGERYMDNPSTNPSGFAQTSLTDKAGSLKARTLLIQGARDNTCVWEHSLSFLQACIDKGIQVDYFPFPLSEHNMIHHERDYLYQKLTDWFLREL